MRLPGKPMPGELGDALKRSGLVEEIRVAPAMISSLCGQRSSAAAISLS